MFLRSLQLCNFGPYRGQHQLTFSTDSDRPITLIGGKNGAGKTTIIEALLVAMYGPRARHRLGFDNYPAFLNALIHKGEQTAGVTLEFTDDTSGSEEHYLVSRCWDLVVGDHASRIKESLSVHIDNERAENFSNEKMWSEHMDQILPLSIAGLVIFDGEKIEELATPKAAAAALRDYVEGLLGLDLVERLGRDLTTFQSRTAKGVVLEDNGELTAELETAQQILDGTQTSVVRSRTNYETAAEAHGRYRAKLEEAQENFTAVGGELFDRRKELTDQASAAKNDMTEATIAAQRLAVGASPLLLVRPLLTIVSEVGERAQETELQQLLLANHKERDERIIEQLENFEAPETKPSPFRFKFLHSDDSAEQQHQRFTDVVRKLLTDDRQTYERSYEPPFSVTSEGTRLAADLAGVGGEQLLEEIAEALEVLRIANQSVDDSEQLADSVPDNESMRAVIQELGEITRQTAEAEVEMTTSSTKLHEDETKYERSQRDFERIAIRVLESESANRDQIRIGREVLKAQKVLDRFRAKITAKSISGIRANILESLKALYRKESLVDDVKIDPETYQVTLLDQQGLGVAQDRLSAGERQLLATGQLWGLSKSTSRKLPTVIDTPVGRLDSSHRTHLVERYFPKASSQVVLLSTDEEIVGRYQTVLEPYVGKSYLLDYETDTNSSRIIEGYFT